jgi:23S rRNA (cytosine1962-C5)-methyltransferase
LSRRAALADRADLNAYRLIHGEADDMPGLAVDRFGEALVVHADSPSVLDECRGDLRHALDTFGVAYAKVHPREPRAERSIQTEVMWGSAADEHQALENGVRYAIRPALGLSVGLFLDMREVRQWVREQAAGRTVLNLFGYTCSFGVCATLGGAARVLNLDLSRGYLAWGEANYRLNGLAVAPRDFVFGDAFDWLARFARRGERYDLVIVDPPSFSTSRAGPFSVEQDYVRLLSAAGRCVSAGGILVAATNHGGTSDARFDAWWRSAMDTPGRHARLARRWHEPAPDFPLERGQQPYLKVRALELD